MTSPSQESDSSPTTKTYKNNILSLGTQQIAAEDIIAVVARGSSDSNQATIFGLAPSLAFQLQTIKTDTRSLPSPFLSSFPVQKLPGYLQHSPSFPNTLHVLISTLAGTCRATEFWDAVLRPLLNEVGWEDKRLNVVRTKSAEGFKEFATGELKRGAEKGVRQTVLLLSGDGGVADLINAISGDERRTGTYTRPILIQIPLGTGNALFHSLHASSSIPSLYVQALRTLFTGSPKALPTFRARFSPGARLLTNEGQTASPIPNSTLYGAVVASYGLHATLVADSDTTAYRKHGAARFGMVANDLLFPKDGDGKEEQPHAYRARVLLDGEVLGEGDRHGYVLATLVSNLEKTFTVSPDSRPLDGKMRVVSFGPMGGEAQMDVMKGAYEGGRHVERGEVGYREVGKMRVEMEEEGEGKGEGEGWRWRRCCVDGLIIGIEEGGWMEVGMVERGEEVVCVVVDGE